MKLARYTSTAAPRSAWSSATRSSTSNGSTRPPQRRSASCSRSASRRRRRIADALRDAPGGHPLAAVKLEAPIPDAQKYLAIGMNYHDHAEEARKAGMTCRSTRYGSTSK